MSKVFIVLGMGRSATSLIGKGLSKAGVDIGDKLIGAKKGNEWGHWEDIDFVKLNDKILDSAGGSWDNPPNEKQILKQRKKFSTEIQELINKKKGDFWGFKDPRTTLTIKLYLPYLKDYDIHFVCCFRKPTEVAKSLEKRDGRKTKESIRISKIYNDRLIRFISWWLER